MLSLAHVPMELGVNTDKQRLLSTSPLSESILQHVPPTLALILIIPHILRLIILMPSREWWNRFTLLDPLYPHPGTFDLILSRTTSIPPSRLVTLIFFSPPIPHEQTPIPIPLASRAIHLFRISKSCGSVTEIESSRAWKSSGFTL